MCRNTFSATLRDGAKREGRYRAKCQHPTWWFWNGKEFIDFTDTKPYTSAYRAPIEAVVRGVAERNEVQVPLAVLCELDGKFQIEVCRIATGNERLPLRADFLKIRQICSVEGRGDRVAIEV